MRYNVLATMALILTVAALSTAAAGSTRDKRPPRPALQRQIAEGNLLAGIRSDNFGLRTSAAIQAGHLRSERMVPALVDMLKNDDDERARIVAALSLYRIGDPIGIHAVRHAARFDESARVRRLCALFYMEYLRNGPEGGQSFPAGLE
jgi:HEAT repeat protein